MTASGPNRVGDDRQVDVATGMSLGLARDVDGPIRATVGWDLGTGLVYLALAQSEIWFFLGDEVSRTTQVVGAVVVTLMAAMLALRSTRPIPAFFAHGVLIAVAIAIGMPGDVYPFGNLILLATVADVAGRRVARVALVTGVVGVGAYFWRFGEPFLFSAFTMVLWALGWAAGRAAQGRRREIQLAHERDLSRSTAEAREAHLALESQRRDIAREIHDLVGHTINVMVVHAGAGRRALGRDRDDARLALETIEQVGRDALGELDGLLAMISAAPTDRRPLLGLSDLERLAAGVRRAGIDVTMAMGVEGTVPRAVGATAYRVVQEALTNTLKHAEATHVEVEVETSGPGLVVTVRDDGSGSTGGAGRGLRGMAERVAAHGGTLEHGDRARGGYRVVATLPVTP